MSAAVAHQHGGLRTTAEELQTKVSMADTGMHNRPGMHPDMLMHWTSMTAAFQAAYAEHLLEHQYLLLFVEQA